MRSSRQVFVLPALEPSALLGQVRSQGDQVTALSKERDQQSKALEELRRNSEEEQRQIPTSLLPRF
eukprot:3774563-Amphidinium_carterae.1